jgi:anti-sigma B factor antagonist
VALQITERHIGDISVLELSGRVTLGDESNQLRTRIKSLLSEGKKNLVLDLGDVNYIDSAGLGTFVAAHTTAQNQGAVMKLANLTKRLTEQLQITKLVTVFDVYGSVENAVHSFGG